MIEIDCRREGCSGVLRLELEDLARLGEVVCPECGLGDQVDSALLGDLELLADLTASIRRAEPILGRTGVAVNVAGKEVVFPYRLLLTRLTTEMALEVTSAPRRIRVYPETLPGPGS